MFLAGIQCFWTNKGMDSRQKHSGKHKNYNRNRRSLELLMLKNEQ